MSLLWPVPRAMPHVMIQTNDNRDPTAAGNPIFFKGVCTRQWQVLGFVFFGG